MSLIFATQLTAVATAVLAAFAIVTALVAGRALRAQNRQLRGELAERRREAEERRRDQASRVFIWTETGTDPAVTPVRRVTHPQPGDYGIVSAHVTNTSQQPVYEITVIWYQGVTAWGKEPPLPVLMPGEHRDFTKPLPASGPRDPDPSRLYSAEVIFRDRNQAWWRTLPDGRFANAEPGSEPSRSR